MPKQVREITPTHLRSEMRAERMGHRLKLLRMALGMKPSEIADHLEIERPYWSRFEGGKRAITGSFAALIVDRFNVTLDFLILGRWDNLPFDIAQRMRDAERQMSGEGSSDRAE